MLMQACVYVVYLADTSVYDCTCIMQRAVLDWTGMCRNSLGFLIFNFYFIFKILVVPGTI